MATWNEVVQHLQKNYKCELKGSDVVRLLFGFGGRSQLVFVSRGAGGAGEWVQIQSPVGKPPIHRLSDLLEACDSKLCGALIMMDGTVFLRHSLPISAYKPEDLDWALQAIVMTADDLEEKYVGGDAF